MVVYFLGTITEPMLQEVNGKLPPLLKLLREVRCLPSLVQPNVSELEDETVSASLPSPVQTVIVIIYYYYYYYYYYSCYYHYYYYYYYYYFCYYNSAPADISISY